MCILICRQWQRAVCETDRTSLLKYCVCVCRLCGLFWPSQSTKAQCILINDLALRPTYIHILHTNTHIIGSHISGWLYQAIWFIMSKASSNTSNNGSHLHREIHYNDMQLLKKKHNLHTLPHIIHIHKVSCRLIKPIFHRWWEHAEREMRGGTKHI